VIASPFLAEPGKKVRLDRIDTSRRGNFKDKEDAADATAKLTARLAQLQERLYAEAKHAVLIVLQAMDTGGKDGAISHVFRGLNPQGCQVTPFKVPSTLEAAHDYLWRIHQAAPPRGMIGIFNRSHYESVLVERVKSLVPEKVWRRRYEHINAFEQMLSDEGTLIVKFFLHISKDEQKARLQARLEDKQKNWKFDPNDLQERKRWELYSEAYQDAVEKCSTAAAPWYIIPADHKWFRNWAISDILVRSLEELSPKFPKPAEGLEKLVVK